MKAKIVSRRGTEAHIVEVGPLKWSGDAYREIQLERFRKIPKNLTMHLGRGYRTAKAKDLPPPAPRPSTEGMTRITGRGTGSRKSRNRGTRSYRSS